MYLKKNIIDDNHKNVIKIDKINDNKIIKKKVEFIETNDDYNNIIKTIDDISKKKNKNNNTVYTIENKENIGDFNEVILLSTSDIEEHIFEKCKILTTNNDYNEKLHYYSIYNDVNDLFSQLEIKFKFLMPIYIRDEWIKESINIKRCYLILDKDNYIPKIYIPSSLKKSILLNKNGPINNPISNNDICLKLIIKHYNDSITLYNNLIYDNVDISIAISILPQSTYVEFIETGSLYDYYKLFKKFKNNIKSIELRDYIIKISEILKKKYPISWNYLDENH